MKIVVVGGTGLIGKKVVALLATGAHEVVAASPSTGVNAATGKGLAAALEGASVVVDVANAPSFEAGPVFAFFEAAGHALAAAERIAGVTHHVALSVVGAERQPDSSYMPAKVEQERLIRASGIPFTIVRSTQFFEFVGAIVAGGRSAGTNGGVRLSPAMMRPIAADDVAEELARVAVGPPSNATVDLVGPELIRMDEFARRHMAAHGDARPILVDPGVGYFGTPVDDRTLLPLGPARQGTTRYDDWLARSRIVTTA